MPVGVEPETGGAGHRSSVGTWPAGAPRPVGRSAGRRALRIRTSRGGSAGLVRAVRSGDPLSFAHGRPGGRGRWPGAHDGRGVLRADRRSARSRGRRSRRCTPTPRACSAPTGSGAPAGWRAVIPCSPRGVRATTRGRRAVDGVGRGRGDARRDRDEAGRSPPTPTSPPNTTPPRAPAHPRALPAVLSRPAGPPRPRTHLLGRAPRARRPSGRAGSDPTTDATGSPPRPGSPGGAGPSGRPGADPPAGQAPPSSTGSAGPDVPDALAAYFPGGDPALLRTAAAAWSRLAEGVDRIVYRADTAFRRLGATGAGAAFSAMREFWAQRFTACATDPLFNAVVNGAGLLSASVPRWPTSSSAPARTSAARPPRPSRDMSPLELPAELLGEIAWGIPELELLVGDRRARRRLSERRTQRLPPRPRPARRAAEPRGRAAPPPGGCAACLRCAGRGGPHRRRPDRGLDLTGTRWDTRQAHTPRPTRSTSGPPQVTHILRGDRSGGGHAPGTGIPGKTEFPRGLDRRRDRRRHAERRARPRSGGRCTAASPRRGGHRDDGVLIRVVLRPDSDIVTSFPSAGPGVVRNPKTVRRGMDVGRFTDVAATVAARRLDGRLSATDRDTLRGYAVRGGEWGLLPTSWPPRSSPRTTRRSTNGA